VARSTNNPWLHRYAVLTALATLGLVGMGGLVTSKGVGMSVPDWPTSYGYNMFALPISTWFTGGIFDEHTHRLWASLVGVLVVALTRWLGGRKACLPLLTIGAVEIVSGFALLRLGPDWKGSGYFLSGIGGVVLLSGMVCFHPALAAMLAKFTESVSGRWGNRALATKLAQFIKAVGARLALVNNAPAARPLPLLGWIAFWLVQLQGLLGGLRVVLDAQVVANVRLGTILGIFHGFLGQSFLVLLGVIALLTSRWWQQRVSAEAGADRSNRTVQRWFIVATVLIFLQLMIGATMRHQHAGLAIPDFPLAYGKLWPATDANSVAHYNAQRIEIMAANPITAAQIFLQMAHRLMAVAILISVGFAAWRARNSELRHLGFTWLGLIFGQAGLGAWTIWSNKAADVATAHVLLGALSLVTGVLGCIICFRRSAAPVESAQPARASNEAHDSFRANPAAVLNQ
jgi:heme a synthase